MKFFVPLFFVLLLAFGCDTPPPAKSPTSVAQKVGDTHETAVLKHADWTQDATIYEVNIRQHTLEGTFEAFEQDIPRLKDMGVEILWLMPIHPIGKENRIGSLGNPYAVRDYESINPEFGDMDSFRKLVNTAHSYGLRVLMDWVSNGTALDHEWVEGFPRFYPVDSLGEILPPDPAAPQDILPFNYENDTLKESIISSMEFWLREAGIDGYRCGDADNYPEYFWETCRKRLSKINRNVFLLGESNNPALHQLAFDATYSYELIRVLNRIAEGTASLRELDSHIAFEKDRFVESAYRVNHLTDHQVNSWSGTIFDRYGESHLAFAALTATLRGMPLVYSGQEVGNQRALNYFEKDTIFWDTLNYQEFYGKLMRLNREEPALWNGHFGGDYIKLNSSNDESLFCFQRQRDSSEVVTILNLSPEPQKVELKQPLEGEYQSIFNKQVLSVFTNGDLTLEPWGYQVFKKEKL